MEIQKFKDRNSTNLNRVTITPENGNAFSATITRNDAPVIEEGTALNATNLNNLGDNISECKETIQELSEKLNNLESTFNTFNTKTTIIDSNANPSIEITTSQDNKQKTINLKIPKQKQGTSYRNKGAWDSSIRYVNNSEFIDTVSFNGCTYFCKITNINTSPIDNADSETWGLMASRSGDGAVTIVDNLLSTNSNYALSANQGRIINNNFALKISSIYKGTCSTATLTASKIVNCPNFILTTGATIDITFQNASVINATLNVNYTGARSIKYQSGDKTLSTANGISLFTNAGGWYGGETIRFIYNGTYWIAVYNVTRGVSIGKFNAYSADTSSKVKTMSKTASSDSKHYLTFVDSNNSALTSNQVYTNEDISYDSYNKTLHVKNISDGTSTKSVSDIINTRVIQLPVGTIFQSAVILNDPAYQKLDGSTFSQDGIYSEFVTWLKQERDKGNVPVYESDEDPSDENYKTAMQKFNNDVLETGNCGKFIIDDENNTFTFPKITSFVQGVANNNEIGNSIPAGIPNITGRVSHNTAERGDPTSEGALYYSVRANGATPLNKLDKFYDENNTITIDASRSSKVYGKSDTVQPNATQYPYYIVVGDAVRSNINVNLENLINELKVKANKSDLQKSIVFKFFAENIQQKVSESDNDITLKFIDDSTEIKINTHGGNLLIKGGVGCYQQNGGNHMLALHVDGEFKDYIASSTSTENSIMPFNYYLTDLPAGEHTVKFVGHVSIGNAVFNEWTMAGVVLQEV